MSRNQLVAEVLSYGDIIKKWVDRTHVEIPLARMTITGKFSLLLQSLSFSAIRFGKSRAGHKFSFYLPNLDNDNNNAVLNNNAVPRCDTLF